MPAQNQMNQKELTELLEQVKTGQLMPDAAAEQIKTAPYNDLGYAKVDYQRELRSGFPEVIYSPGKTIPQIVGIVKDMLSHSEGNILISRTNEETYQSLQHITGDAQFYPEACSIIIQRKPIDYVNGKILIVSAGTSDIPIAEEAAVTADIMGNPVERLFDVGVAGIHRLLANTSVINRAQVVIVIAGMEGALASVVGGLTDKPVIAVPTSVGYGANFGGLSALLGMLTSCANGISVVNIDNGYGAACMASKINHL